MDRARTTRNDCVVALMMENVAAPYPQIEAQSGITAAVSRTGARAPVHTDDYSRPYFGIAPLNACSYRPYPTCPS